MNIRIISPGKTKQRFIQDGIDEYMKRLKPFAKIDWIATPDQALRKTNTIEIVKQTEAEHILKRIEPGFTIALDEHGKEMTSPELADLLSKHDRIQFVIGGVYGMSDEVRKKSDLVLSFSRFTMTHQMIRLVLVEQIYRAFTILQNKKYHY